MRRSTRAIRWEIDVRDSKVVVVGNGPSAIAEERGAEIDAANAVIRMNFYRIGGYERFVGTRTDFWVSHMNWFPEENDYLLTGLDKLKAVWVFARRGGCDEGEKDIWEDVPPAYQKQLRGIPLVNTGYDWYFELHKEVGDFRPSCGYGAIALILLRLRPTELLLIGFDFILTGKILPRYDYYWGFWHPAGLMGNLHMQHEGAPLRARLAANGYSEEWTDGGCALFVHKGQ